MMIQQLERRLHDDSERTFRLDWQALHSTLNKYCTAVTRSMSEAEDLVQDTWHKAIRSGQLYKHPNAEAWLLTIARNTWHDRLRRKSVEQRAVEAGFTKFHDKAEPLDSGLAIEGMLNVLFKHLTKQQVAVFIVREVFEYNVKDTAMLLQLTEGAVKATLLRARASLTKVRRELRELGWNEPKDEQSKWRLYALAHALQEGNVFEWLALIHMDGMGEMEINARSQLLAKQLSAQQNIKAKRMKHSADNHVRMLAA